MPGETRINIDEIRKEHAERMKYEPKKKTSVKYSPDNAPIVYSDGSNVKVKKDIEKKYSENKNPSNEKFTETFFTNKVIVRIIGKHTWKGDVGIPFRSLLREVVNNRSGLYSIKVSKQTYSSLVTIINKYPDLIGFNVTPSQKESALQYLKRDNPNYGF